MYQKILAAVDDGENAELVLARAVALADGEVSRVHLLHVADGPITGYGDVTANNHIASDIHQKQRIYPVLKSLAAQFGIDCGAVQLLSGRTADVIHQTAEQNNFDVIVVGSHGREGVRLLLGSTANEVVHGASCDVYTVRVPDA